MDEVLEMVFVREVDSMGTEVLEMVFVREVDSMESPFSGRCVGSGVCEGGL